MDRENDQIGDCVKCRIVVNMLNYRYYEKGRAKCSGGTFCSARLSFDLNSYYVVISDRSRIHSVDLGIIRGKYVKLSHIINDYTVVAESLCNVIV